MSVKFPRTGSPLPVLVSTGTAAKTLPNSTWTYIATIVFDGPMSGYGGQAQYLVSTGAFQSAGSMNMLYVPTDGTVLPGKAYLYLDTSNSPYGVTGGTLVSGGSYTIAWHRNNDGTISVRHCPTLAAMPTDGSAVIAGTTNNTTPLTTALTGSGNFTIGDRADQPTDRVFGQSAARITRIDGVILTDFELAKIAYGMSPTDIGKTPAIYVRANDRNDLTDTGTQANTFSATPTTITNGTAPGFGYVVPSAAPAITSPPTISGGATVGAPSTVVRGSYTGSPTPTPSYQWNINGVPVSGATGTTYSPVSSDSGKTLTVTQTETNGVGSPATSTSAGSTVAPAATSTVDAADQIAERVYPRTNGVAIVGSTGTWTGATQPASFEYQFIAVDGTTVIKTWASLNATVSANNTWSASTVMPQSPNGYKHFIQYRSKDSGGNVLATSPIKTKRFAVGDIVGFIGSSSAEKAFYTDSGTGFTPDPDRTSRYDGSWYTIDNGCAIQMASSLAIQSGVPVAFLDYGIGGSAIADWVNTTYSQWQAFASGVASVGGMSSCLITIGSNDAAYGYVTSRASHLANWRTLIAHVRALVSQNIPVCSIGYNRRTDTTVSASQFALGSDYVRMAENDVADDTGVCGVQTMDFLLSSDGIHLASVDTGFPAWGRRIAYQFGLFLKGTYLRGPKQTQMTSSGVTTVHTLQHRGSTDFTPTTGITGYTALDSSNAAIALVSSVRTNATTITNTWASAPAKVQYLEGSAPPVGTPVFGNTSSPLPMTVETDMAITAQLATTVTFSAVKDLAGTPADNASGLDYAIYEATRLNANILPIKYGSNLAIANGSVTLDITGVTTLPPGGSVRVNYGTADGSKVASAVVVVS